MAQANDTRDGDDDFPTLNAAPRLVAAPYTMDPELKPWDLYSLDGAEELESLETMKQYFTRSRATRGKSTNNAHTHDALQRSWCAFIRRWNAARRDGETFASWLEEREERRGEHSTGELRTRICNMATEAWRMCYVHLREGCTTCAANCERPTRAAWDEEVQRWPLAENERHWIGRYERTLSELERAQRNRERGRNHDCSRSRSRGEGHRGRSRRSRNRQTSQNPPPVRGHRRSRSRSRSRSRRRDDSRYHEHTRSWERGQQRDPRSLSPARARPRSPSPRRGYLPSSGYGASTYLPLVNIPASGPDSASQRRAPAYSSTEGQAHGAHAYHDPRFARRPGAERPTRQQVGANHRGGRSGHGIEATLQSRRSGGAPVSSVSQIVEAPRGSLPVDHPERLTIAQYNLMVAEAQQARYDALDAHRLAEGAREDANAATVIAQQARHERSQLVERLRQLETATFGATQRNMSARERQGLGPSRRQRRRRGTSDYEPAHDPAGGDRGSPPGGTA